MNIEEVGTWLIENEYAVIVKGVVRLTPKFAKAMKSSRPQGVIKAQGQLMVQAVEPPNIKSFDITKAPQYNIEDWRRLYLEIIAFCKVPDKIVTRTSTYRTNEYSIDAMKRVMKALKNEEISLKDLMWCIIHYYHENSDVQMKKSITSYIIDDIWLNDLVTLQAKKEKQGNGAYKIDIQPKHNDRYTDA